MQRASVTWPLSALNERACLPRSMRSEATKQLLILPRSVWSSPTTRSSQSAVTYIAGHVYTGAVLECSSRRSRSDAHQIRERRWKLAKEVSECPVCKAALTDDKIIPLYGRGTVLSRDPRKHDLAIPQRPAAQRPPTVSRYSSQCLSAGLARHHVF